MRLTLIIDSLIDTQLVLVSNYAAAGWTPDDSEPWTPRRDKIAAAENAISQTLLSQDSGA
ncbi:hypothetical protein JOB18_024330 [Solea senegalensis]|uniref:Uncharacterized protein n=1 Tax=Solea senegalensis TaxID=28829 RepID=A0AAV6QB46_SOLSE|nr:hypothetical protein JOB18_024330 [Solea senegalensis]